MKLRLTSPSARSKLLTKDHHQYHNNNNNNNSWKSGLHPSLVDSEEDGLFPEPQKTTISSRTGGFEVPQSDTFPLVDDDTTLQTATVYTNGERHHHHHHHRQQSPVTASDNATFRSSATTVKMGTKQQQRPASVIDVDDIRPQLQKFKRNLRLGLADKLACAVGVKAGQSSNDSCCSSLSSHPVREVASGTISESGGAPLPPPAATISPRKQLLLKRNRLPLRDGGENQECEAPPVTTVTSYIPTPGVTNNNKFDPCMREEAEDTPKRRNKPAVSFTFQNNESGAGVEVLDKRISPSKVRITTPTKTSTSNNKKKEQRDQYCSLPIDLDDEDDDSYSSYSYTNFQKANVDDHNLMKRSSSPGAIRLTAEGLQRHEHLASKEPRPRAASDNVLEAWKLQRFEREHKVKKMQKQNQEMEIRALRRAQEQTLRKRTESDPFSEFGYSERQAPDANKRKSPKKRISIIKTIKSSLQKEDVTDVSLAPLNEIAREAAPLSQEQQKPGLLGRFRRSPSQAAKAILEKERKAAEEAKMRQMILEQKEKERIHRKRLAYLEYQRARERDSSIDKLPSPSTSPRKQPLSSFSSIFLSNYLDDDVHTGTTHEVSTLSSKSSVSLPPCKVCGKGERTHIAAPCMHFAFCKDCAAELESKPQPVCPICSQDVTFAYVSVH